jgi:AcrR family transcriptional regulator
MKDSWLENGYRTFAVEGPKQLRVERLAREVGKSKSSFYHHYADMEVFISNLLSTHLEQINKVAQKEASCESLEELIDVIVEHKYDLLFNRQLRIHRENSDYIKCYEKANEMTIESIQAIWAGFLGLTQQTYLARMVLVLVLENFFLQISEQNLTKEWLTRYFEEIKNMIAAFKKNPNLLKVDGTG